MPRMRTIKPEFCTSEQVVECSPTARLLFIQLWMFCDDAGRHPASTKRLKMEVFPGDSFSDDEMQGWIDELVSVGLLMSYVVDGEEFWQVTGWRHQKIEKPYVRYPAPPKIDTHSANGRRTVGERSAYSPPPEPEPEPEPEKEYKETGVRFDERSVGVFSKLTDKDLKSTETVLSFVKSGTESDQVRYLAAAERAIEVGKKPVALFVRIVTRGDWHLINAQQEDRAMTRLREYRRSARDGPPINGNGKSIASSLAETLAIKGHE